MKYLTRTVSLFLMACFVFLALGFATLPSAEGAEDEGNTSPEMDRTQFFIICVIPILVFLSMVALYFYLTREKWKSAQPYQVQLPRYQQEESLGNSSARKKLPSAPQLPQQPVQRTPPTRLPPSREELARLKQEREEVYNEEYGE